MPYTKAVEVVENDVVVGFECDRCEKSYHEANGDDWIEIQEAMHWKMIGGYGSIWGDDSDVEIVLCQKCAHELLSPFVTINGKKLIEKSS